MKLSIIIPAKNEEKRIKKTLESYLKFFKSKFKDNFEILVILNACTDNSAKVIQEFRRKYKKSLNYEDIKEPIGKGGALIKGFRIANSDLVGFVDADGSTQPDAFYDLVVNIGDYDGVIASRWMKGSIVSPKQSLSRRVFSRGFNFLINFLLGLNVHDSQCGAKLFKKNAVKKVVDELNITQWAFDINLLFLMKIHGFRIKEIPTMWHDELGSRLKIWKATFEMFLSLVRLRLLYSPMNSVIKLYDSLPEGIKLHHRLR